METISAKKGGRVYKRRFDHDLARERFAQGASAAALAREYGVTEKAVLRVLDPDLRAKMYAASQAYFKSGVCVVCGKEGVTRLGHNGRGKGRCQRCASIEAATTVRPDTLQCVTCQHWLPDECFLLAKSGKRRYPTRRGRISQCRQCQSAARREYRARHRVPCQRCGELVEGKGRASKTYYRKDGQRVHMDPARPHLCRRCWHEERK
jgi:hypothetical protein